MASCHFDLSLSVASLEWSKVAIWWLSRGHILFLCKVLTYDLIISSCFLSCSLPLGHHTYMILGWGFGFFVFVFFPCISRNWKSAWYLEDVLYPFVEWKDKSWAIIESGEIAQCFSNFNMPKSHILGISLKSRFWCSKMEESAFFFF